MENISDDKVQTYKFFFRELRDYKEPFIHALHFRECTIH